VADVFPEDVHVHVTNQIPNIIAFAQERNCDVACVFYQGCHDSYLRRLISGLKNNGLKIIGNNVFSYYDHRMDDLFDVVYFQTIMMRDIKFKGNLVSGKRLDQKKYHVIYNPVDTDYLKSFAMSPKQRDKLRLCLGFTAKDFVVGRFGRDDIVKWGDFLSAAFFTLLGDPNIKFLIMGIPFSRRLLIWITAMIVPALRRKIVVLAPTKNETLLFSLYQVVDILGHAVKIGEACSNAINEAMYWRKPVITNSTPHCDNGQVEQVEQGRTGIVVNNGEEFCRAIGELKNSPDMRRRMGELGHQKVMKGYRAQLIVREFEMIVLEAMGRNRETTPATVTQEMREAFVKRYGDLVKRRLTSPPFWRRIAWFVLRSSDYAEYRLQPILRKVPGSGFLTMAPPSVPDQSGEPE